MVALIIAIAICTYFLIYRTVALISAPKKPQSLIYHTLALICPPFYFNHIYNANNPFVELYINYTSKISYLSSLIFGLGEMCITCANSRRRRLKSETEIHSRIFCE